MAVPHLNSGERQSIYRSLFLINRCFDSIVQRISGLENAQKLNAQHFEELLGLTQEVQLHINNRLIEEIHTLERSDWYYFGAVRKAIEIRLDPTKEQQPHPQEKPEKE